MSLSEHQLIRHCSPFLVGGVTSTDALARLVSKTTHKARICIIEAALTSASTESRRAVSAAPGRCQQTRRQ